MSSQQLIFGHGDECQEEEKDMKTPQESFYGSLDVTDHLLDHNFLEDIAKDRKVIPDPIDDRKFQE